MKKSISLLLLMGLLTLINNSSNLHAQCVSNIGFESGSFSGWTTSTDSLFIQPANRVYSKPGISPKIVSYGITDQWMGTITRPNVACGNYMVRVGNKGLRAVADTVYRTYVIDSLSDKLIIYCKGISEQAHNYWGVPTIEAPGFGYEIYINGQKMDCLKGSFFCGNTDTPAVWQLGSFKDTAGVRKSTGWARETLNFACYVGDTIEIRLFTRDCILLGHYAYAYFDVVCGDTSKPVISQIMLNDFIEGGDELDLYCETSTTLYLEPNTDICPITRGSVVWSPASYVSGSVNLDSVRLQGLDSVWIKATATFSNGCQSLNVSDSIYVRVLSNDPHDNIPKMPRNFCDCAQDTLDFGTTTVTQVTDQFGNTLTLNNGLLVFTPCDNFYEESFWKAPSAKIVTRGSQIGTVGWTTGNIEGAIGVDSILATGRVRYIIDYVPGKSFYAGITENNSNNNNDIDHAIYYNGGNIRSYYNGTNLTNLGTYTGTVTVDFVTLSNRRVQIWINGILAYSYSNAQRIATFPVFADFSARSNDTNLIRKTYVYGPTKNIKNFTRLLVPTTVSYYIQYEDRCGVLVHDTIRLIPGFEANMASNDLEICGLNPLSVNLSATASIIDDIMTTSTGNGTITINNSVTPGGTSVVTYAPDQADFAASPVTVFMTAQSGRCFDVDTVDFTFYEEPLADAGPDISTTADSFLIGGSPAGSCATCNSFNFDWNQGYALSDSTTGNPFAYKNLLTSTQMILRVTDPTTTCFSLDTTNVYTSLDNGDVLLNTNCLSGNRIEFSWNTLTSDDNYKFGIEYSTDFGETWVSAGEVKAALIAGHGPSDKYAITIDRIANAHVIYRWYSSNVRGERTSLLMLENANCGSRTIYNARPNPFTDRIEINFHSETAVRANYTVLVYNQYGQLMLEKAINSREAALTGQIVLEGLGDLAKGMYYLNIRTEQSTLYSTMMVKTE